MPYLVNFGVTTTVLNRRVHRDRRSGRGADVLAQMTIELAAWDGEIPEVSPTAGEFERGVGGVGSGDR